MKHHISGFSGGAWYILSGIWYGVDNLCRIFALTVHQGSHTKRMTDVSQRSGYESHNMCMYAAVLSWPRNSARDCMMVNIITNKRSELVPILVNHSRSQMMLAGGERKGAWCVTTKRIYGWLCAQHCSYKMLLRLSQSCWIVILMQARWLKLGQKFPVHTSDVFSTVSN